MPQTGPMILRKARDTAKLTREQLEVLMHVSKTTIKAWEYGERKPESSDVARLGEIVKDDTLWPRWMCATDDEYARRHPFLQSDMPSSMAVVNAGYEMGDVAELTEAVARCLISQKKDPALAGRWVKEAEEAASALLGAINQMRKGG